MTNLFARFTGSGDRFSSITDIRLVDGSAQFIHRDFASDLEYSTEFGSWSPSLGPASSQVDSFLAAGNGPGANSTPIGPEGDWSITEGFHVAQPPFASLGTTCGFYAAASVVVGPTERLFCARFVTTTESTAIFVANVRWTRPGEQLPRVAAGGFVISPFGDDLCPENADRSLPGQCGCEGVAADTDADGAEDCWDSATGKPIHARWQRQTPDGGNVGALTSASAVAVIPRLIAVGSRTAFREVVNQGGIAIVEEFGQSLADGDSALWSSRQLLTDPESPPNALVGASVAAGVAENGDEIIVGGSYPDLLATPVAMPVVVWRRPVGASAFEVVDRIAPIGTAPSTFSFGRSVALQVVPGIGEDIFVAGEDRLFVFRRLLGAKNWTLRQTILPPSGASDGFLFPSNLKTVGRTVVVKATLGEFGSFNTAIYFYDLQSRLTTAAWTIRAIVQPPSGFDPLGFAAIPLGSHALTTPRRADTAIGTFTTRLAKVAPAATGGAGTPLDDLAQPLLQPFDGFAARSQYFAIDAFGDVAAASGEPGTYVYRRVVGDQWVPFTFVPVSGNALLGTSALVQFIEVPATASLAANEIRITPLGQLDCDGDGVNDRDLDGDALPDCIDPDDDGDGVDDESDNPADLNNDGTVDATDLAILLGNWGEPGVSDINGNGFTDGQDLSFLLNAWSAD
ncbi:MAG: hypothetical protein QM516_11650 [Limnohabitans sp.]|nr:hypothetical protein [Limnohabitans sp.]